MSDKRNNDQYSKQEAQQRFERLVRAALNTPPENSQEYGAKGDAVAIEEAKETA